MLLWEPSSNSYRTENIKQIRRGGHTANLKTIK